MDKLERLILEQALYKMVGKDVDTKTSGNLRSEADDYYRTLFEESGAKTFALKLNGQPVGTYSVRTTKGSADSVSEVFAADVDALSDWDLGGLAERFAIEHIREYAEWYFRETGELPPGCRIEYVVQEGVPAGRYVGGTLKVEPYAVMDVLRDGLPEAVAGLFGEGEQDD